MTQKETCYKCGKSGDEVKLIYHHQQYATARKEEKIIMCCRSCHKKIDHSHKQDGTACPLDVAKRRRLSALSYIKRTRKEKIFFETLMPNVLLFEKIVININTGNICITSYFNANNGKKLKYIDI